MSDAERRLEAVNYCVSAEGWLRYIAGTLDGIVVVTAEIVRANLHLRICQAALAKVQESLGGAP